MEFDLDNVTLAGEAQALRPDRQRTPEGDPFGGFVTRQIGVFMDQLAAEGMFVGFEDAFDVNQRGPPGTEQVLVDGGERDGLALSAPIRQRWQSRIHIRRDVGRWSGLRGANAG